EPEEERGVERPLLLPRARDDARAVARILEDRHGAVKAELREHLLAEPARGEEVADARARRRAAPQAREELGHGSLAFEGPRPHPPGRPRGLASERGIL